MIFQSLVLGSLILLALVLALVVLVNNPGSRTNRYYVGLNLAAAWWLAANALSSVRFNPAFDLFIIRQITPASVLAVMFFAYLSSNFPIATKHGKRELFWAIPALIVAALSFTSLNVYSVVKDGAVAYELGALYIPYVGIMLGYTVFGMFALFGKMHGNFSGYQAVQIKYMAIGLALTIIPALFFGAILPVLGVNSLGNFAPYFAFFFLSITAYAIVRHRLFDVRLLVARTLTYALLLATIATVYALALFGITRVAFPGNVTSGPQTAINIALAIVLAFTFQPLRRFFEKLTDSIFYRDHYDTQDVLNGIGRILTSELMIEPLLAKSLTAVCTSLHIEWGQFIIFNDDKIYLISNHGKLPNKLVVASSLAHLGKTIMVADELEGGVAKEVMDDHSISVSVVLRTKGEFVGYLLLGDKLSGEIYSTQDIALLHILSSQLAVAIENAKAYAEIAQFNETLQERIRQATKRLRVANAHLKELDKAKDEFISMASHQLRTPLTAIKGYLSMILEGDMGPVAAEQTEFLTYAYDGSERMVTLISDLLNVSRMSAGRFLIERQPTDVVSMVSDEVRQLQSTAKTKNLKLTFTPPTKVLPLVLLDEGKTRQVIMNFIDNALYYTKEGGVTVSLDVRDKTFELRVKDTGIGVPPEAQAKLFTKFFRAENAQNVRPDGTGLGLYLAKRVVEDQGGELIFETEINKGSTFGFRLPILAAKPLVPGK